MHVTVRKWASVIVTSNATAYINIFRPTTNQRRLVLYSFRRSPLSKATAGATF